MNILEIWIRSLLLQPWFHALELLFRSLCIRIGHHTTHKGRWFNFFVSLVLVGSTGYALAVHSDPRVLCAMISTVLLYVTRANTQTKESWFLLGDRRVPISLSHRPDGVITDVKVNTEHAHLINSLYQGGRNIAVSVSSGEGVVELKMKES